MTDDPNALLDALAKRHALPGKRRSRPSKPEGKGSDSFTLSLSIDQDFRRRIRLLAARDNLSIIDLVRAAIAAYEQQRGVPKDL